MDFAMIKFTDRNGKTGEFLFDVLVSEDHTFENEITDYPVESGGSFSDNIRRKPIRLTMDGIVSNHPIGGMVAKREAVSDREPVQNQFLPRFLAPPAAGNRLMNPAGEVTYVEDAYNFLLARWNSGEAMTVRTSLGTFENMAMQSLSIPRDGRTGDALRFTAAFQQIQTFSNQKLRNPSIRNGKGRTNRGSKPALMPPYPWRVDQIAWRRGRPPGSDSIYAIETVRFYLPLDETALFGAGKVYFWSGPKGFRNTAGPQPLNSQENREFTLDYNRDKRQNKLKIRRVQLDYTDADMEIVEHESGSVDLSKYGPPTRTPVHDLNEANRVKLVNGSGFDPLIDAFKRPFAGMP